MVIFINKDNMNRQQKIIDVNGTDVEYRLDSPAWNSNKWILYIPGWSGWDFERYPQLVKGLIENNFHFMQLKSWITKDEILQMNIKMIHDQIDALLHIFQDQGVSELGVLGKSAGAATAILLKIEELNIKTMSLLAPPSVVRENFNRDNALETIFNDMRLKDSDTWEVILNPLTWKPKAIEVPIGEEYLRNIKIPIQIIRGEDDNVVSLEQSTQVSSLLTHPNSKFVPIAWVWHSYGPDESGTPKVFDHVVEHFKVNI